MEIARNVIRMTLEGDVSGITVPGQFINLRTAGGFLRRPISVSDVDTGLTGSARIAAEAAAGGEPRSGEGNSSDAFAFGAPKSADPKPLQGTVTILYKAVGAGTRFLSGLRKGDCIDTLTGLGNGFEIRNAGDAPLLIGGGIGAAPMMLLAKRLIEDGVRPNVVLGFNTAADVILKEDLYEIGCEVYVSTVDGSKGQKGFVTDLIRDLQEHGIDYSYFYACGPEPMLRAVYKATHGEGELSLEERMGCGFGACMGCSIETADGPRRICKDGPVFQKSSLCWNEA